MTSLFGSDAIDFESMAHNGGPSGLPPPGMHIKITAVIICGMLVNELHWIGWWVLVTLSGNS